MSGFSPPDPYTTPLFTNEGYMFYQPSQRLWSTGYPNHWDAADSHTGTVYLPESVNLHGQFNPTMKPIPTFPTFQSQSPPLAVQHRLAPSSPPLPLGRWALSGVAHQPTSSSPPSVNPSPLTPPPSITGKQTVTGIHAVSAGHLPPSTTTGAAVHRRSSSINGMASSLVTRLHELPLDKQGILTRRASSSSPSSSASSSLLFRHGGSGGGGAAIFEAMLSLMEFCIEAERMKTTAEPDAQLTDRLLLRLNRYTPASGGGGNASRARVGSELYKCLWPDCGREVSRRPNAVAHLMSHCHYKPFVCQDCEHHPRFRYKHDYTRHCRNHVSDSLPIAVSSDYRFH